MSASVADAKVSGGDESPDNRVTERFMPRQSVWSRVKVLIRRIHLYTGLFLLPWVFLYGVTAAMFNHEGLFPEVTIQPVADSVFATSPMADFPTPQQLARQVVDTLQTAAGDSRITLADDPRAEFTNPVMFEVTESGIQHVVQIDPVNQTAQVVLHPTNEESPQAMLTNVSYIKLNPNPLDAARESASQILIDARVQASGEPKPFSWSKLNFLASVDGEPARVTYVLRDGHVDVTKYTGEDGMTLRRFLLKLHTGHGQSPHWNGRTFWSLVVDVMAVAMVCWGLTGLFMWWQLKRARFTGSMVIALSLAMATLLYLGVHDFYVKTKL